jgi:hypothetical protein
MTDCRWEHKCQGTNFIRAVPGPHNPGFSPCRLSFSIRKEIPPFAKPKCEGWDIQAVPSRVFT